VHGEAFNVGPANGVTISRLATSIADILQWKGELHWDTCEMRPGEILYLNSSNEKIHTYIGWDPVITLQAGLERTCAYWKDKLSRLEWKNPRA
jgi:nucleoside-diphosphate-sugar epimerase